ncbi:Zinc finger CCCH-type [Arabidopsis suecica]|uniref:Zinc finger CCCH-type n=1 Tax=Arabidopsis suecica TaxID=45249 RepID=A0A8T2BSR0_ARASU|nr:Zinc finger CCCH-type [Arabidopsis suecica]
MENKIAPFSYSGSSADVVGIKKSQGDSSCSGVVSSSLYSDQLYKSTRNIMQQRQDMVNREALCYTRLHEASLEAEALRLENTELRSMNRHLKTELNSLIRSSIQNRFDLRSPLRMLSNLSIGGNDADEVENQNQNRTVNRDDVSDESPTSVMENEDLNRSSLPKSISVRSSGYSKASQGGGGAVVQCGKPRGTVTKPGTCGQVSTTQKVYVRGGGKKEDQEEEIEVEVYNQGMTKTELCNKWQETGTCPYGDHCQFAHGIKELRPVIRHPRYKTEVCRMVLAGDNCPYGHRCHFRHSLSEQEKLVAAGFKPKSSLKLLT